MFDLENKVKIRPFDEETDYPDALKCFNEGFRHILWPFIDHADPSLNLDFIRLFYKLSPDSFVAEIDGEVHGLLMGAAPFKTWGIIKAMFFAFFIMLPKLLFNRYKFDSLVYKHLGRFAYGAAPWLILQPFEWPMSEVNLFTSRRRFRGRGMGRMLMDAFFDVVKKNDQSGVSVCTDTSLSYWFYESYGFKVEKKFKMKAYKYSIPHESFTGLIYYFNLNGNNRKTGHSINVVQRFS